MIPMILNHLVSKVIMTPHVVLPNGTQMTQTGIQQMLKIAHFYKKQIISLVGVHELCPTFPNQRLMFENGVSREDDSTCPMYDVCNEKVYYLTNHGGFESGDIHRLIKESYSSLDSLLF